MKRAFQDGERVRIVRCRDDAGNPAYVGRTATVVGVILEEAGLYEVRVDGPHADWWMDAENGFRPNHSSYYESELAKL